MYSYPGVGVGTSVPPLASWSSVTFFLLSLVVWAALAPPIQIETNINDNPVPISWVIQTRGISAPRMSTVRDICVSVRMIIYMMVCVCARMIYII